MQELYSLLFSSLPGEITAAVILYLAGYATSRVLSKFNQKRKITVLHRRTESAFQAIEAAEQKFSKDGKGSKKLEYATHYLMANADIRNYEEAQNLILQCFPLTRLYHD